MQPLERLHEISQGRQANHDHLSNRRGLGQGQGHYRRRKRMNALRLQSRLQLLGQDSNDIDIALSDMMGLAFAEHLSAYAELKGVEAGRISKIAQNPDQSKHLETATLTLGGLDIDLVNLRSEEYAENSRIPTGVVRNSHSKA